MPRLLGILQLEKMPYIVTLLFLSIGWGVTHTVDRALKSPIIELSTEIKGANPRRMVATVRNVSHDVSFKNLTFTFLLPEGHKFSEAFAHATPPAWEGNAAPRTAARSATFDLPALHPEGEIRLVVAFEGKTLPELRLQSAESAVRLVQPSFETFIVRHETTLIAGMMTLWIVAIVVVLFYSDAGGERRGRLLSPDKDIA